MLQLEGDSTTQLGLLHAAMPPFQLLCHQSQLNAHDGVQ
jgi:hypothetical protein